MPNAPMSFDELKARVGQEIGVSDWFTVDQTMIDQFADCTRDHQWIHVDVERAKRESPYGAPVAHGFLTLSLLAAMSYQIGARPDGLAASFNYGLDKVRFIAPVTVGSKVRLRSTLTAFEEKEPGRVLMKSHAVIEIEGEEKPALVADTLVLLVAQERAAG